MYGGPGLPRPSTVTRSLHELQHRGSVTVGLLNQVARDGFTRVHPEGFTQRGVLRWGLLVAALAAETVTALDAGVRRYHHALQGHQPGAGPAEAHPPARRQAPGVAGPHRQEEVVTAPAWPLILRRAPQAGPGAS